VSFPTVRIVELTFCARYVRLNTRRAARLHDALQNLSDAICEVENAVAEMKANQDPLASHIFVSRRQYRAASDTKSGKRREVAARLSYNSACTLGFRGSLDEWERLMGAAARR
jgi:septal ring factor EnvC (AmiA/AmiB activator)